MKIDWNKNNIFVLLGAWTFFIAVTSPFAFAETELKFENTVSFGDSDNELANSSAVLNGYLYLAGAKSNSKSLSVSYTLPPLNQPSSNFAWQNDPASSDVFNDVAITDEGQYYAGRSTPKTGIATGMLAKFEANQTSPAAAKWVVKPDFIKASTDGELRGLAIDGDFIYVTGSVSSQANNRTAVLAKYDKNGQLIWSKTLSETKERNRAAGTAIAVLNGNIYVAGYSGSGGKSVDFSEIVLKLTLWKYDGSGNQIWKKESSKLYSQLNSVQVDAAVSGAYLYVAALKHEDKNEKVWILKYNEDGKVVWDTEWVPTLEEDEMTPQSVHLAMGSMDRMYAAGQAGMDDEKDSRIFLLEIDKEYGSVLASHDRKDNNFSQNILSVTTDDASKEVFLAGSKTSYKKSADSDLMLMRFVPLPVTQVKIDINPLKSEELNSKGKPKEKAKKNTIPVAIFSTPNFDAPVSIKQSSLTFGRTGNEPSWDSCSMKDINSDGKLDLLCYFKNQVRIRGNLTEVAKAEDGEGILKGQLNSGVRLKGMDSVLDLPATTSAEEPESEPEPEAEPAEEPEPSAPNPEPVPASPMSSQPALPPVEQQPTPEPTQSTPVQEPVVQTPTSAPPSSEPIVLTTTLIIQPTTQSIPTPNSGPVATEPMSTSGTVSFEPNAPVNEPQTVTKAPEITTSNVTQTNSEPATTTTTPPQLIEPVTTAPMSFSTATNMPSTNSTNISTTTAPPTVTSPTTSIQKFTMPSLMPTKNKTEAPIVEPVTTPATAVTAPMPEIKPMPTLSSSSSTTPAAFSPMRPVLNSAYNSSSNPNAEQFLRKILRSETPEPEPEEASAERPESDQELSSKPAESSGLASAFRDMGKEAIRNNQPLKAIEYFQEALQYQPNSAELHSSLGLAFMETGKLEEARTHFTEAVRLNPEDQLSRSNLDTILIKLKS